jgi:hypothetical protein
MGFLGTILLSIGILIIDCFRETGQRAFLWIRAKRPFFPRLWLGPDERGYQFLFLGVGIFFGVAGGVLIVTSILS